jgi:hypothetical protein
MIISLRRRNHGRKQGDDRRVSDKGIRATTPEHQRNKLLNISKSSILHKSRNFHIRRSFDDF